MNNLEASYNLILNELKKIVDCENFYFKPIKPQLSDFELTGLIILAEFKSIDSECQLFREIKGFEIETKIERSVYNRRKRIETPFSQLFDQFMIRRNYAKTFGGFKTRILAKITALTFIQYLNKFVFSRNINNLKINLV